MECACVIALIVIFVIAIWVLCTCLFHRMRLGGGGMLYTHLPPVIEAKKKRPIEGDFRLAVQLALFNTFMQSVEKREGDVLVLRKLNNTPQTIGNLEKSLRYITSLVSAQSPQVREYVGANLINFYCTLLEFSDIMSGDLTNANGIEAQKDTGLEFVLQSQKKEYTWISDYHLYIDTRVASSFALDTVPAIGNVSQDVLSKFKDVTESTLDIVVKSSESPYVPPHYYFSVLEYSNIFIPSLFTASFERGDKFNANWSLLGVTKDSLPSEELKSACTYSLFGKIIYLFFLPTEVIQATLTLVENALSELIDKTSIREYSLLEYIKQFPQQFTSISGFERVTELVGVSTVLNICSMYLLESMYRYPYMEKVALYALYALFVADMRRFISNRQYITFKEQPRKFIQAPLSQVIEFPVYRSDKSVYTGHKIRGVSYASYSNLLVYLYNSLRDEYEDRALREVQEYFQTEITENMSVLDVLKVIEKKYVQMKLPCVLEDGHKLRMKELEEYIPRLSENIGYVPFKNLEALLYENRKEKLMSEVATKMRARFTRAPKWTSTEDNIEFNEKLDPHMLKQDVTAKHGKQTPRAELSTPSQQPRIQTPISKPGRAALSTSNRAPSQQTPISKLGRAELLTPNRAPLTQERRQYRISNYKGTEPSTFKRAPPPPPPPPTQERRQYPISTSFKRAPPPPPPPPTAPATATGTTTAAAAPAATAATTTATTATVASTAATTTAPPAPPAPPSLPPSVPPPQFRRRRRDHRERYINDTYSFIPSTGSTFVNDGNFEKPGPVLPPRPSNVE